MALPDCLQPRQLVAAAYAAQGGRQLVADQPTTATGENRRTVDQARAVLLAAPGREPPHAAAVQRHAEENHRAAVAGGIARCWVADRIGLTGKQRGRGVQRMAPTTEN